MPGPRINYIRIKPTKDSQLKYDEAKELIGYLSQINHGTTDVFIKSRQTGLELYVGADRAKVYQVINKIYALSPESVAFKTKASEIHIKRPSLNANFTLKHHYSYPVFVDQKGTHTSLSLLLNHLYQLGANSEILIHIQAKELVPLRAKILRRRLLNGAHPPLRSRSVVMLLANWLMVSFSLLSAILANIVKMLNNKEDLFHPSTKVVNPISVALLDKLYDRLFKADLMVQIKSNSKQQALILAQEIESTLNSFASSNGYQQFALSNKNYQDIYSLADIASLFNYQSSDIKSGIFQIELLKTLPNHQAGKDKQPGDVVIGKSNYKGSQADIVIKAADRYRHAYICGATGSGKSTLLANLALQDVMSNQGLTLIDVHGDLATELYEHIPNFRREDVVYFDPADKSSSVKLNLLETNTAFTDHNVKDQITESVISVFRKLYGEDNNAHRIEYILRNSIQTCLLLPNSTIFTIYSLLTDTNFRLNAINSLKDKDLINFWRNELGRAGDYQRVKMTSGVTAKIGRFLFSPSAKRTFSEYHSTLDLNEIMNKRKILICNFSKGKLGEDGAKLFATTLLAKLQLSAISSANNPKIQRVDHYLYVDEFQSYAPSVLIQILSEARKYGLYLTMAEQSPSQQDALSTSAILANVGNLICFRTASYKDEQLLIQNFKEYLSPADLNNLPAYNFYLKTAAERSWPPTSGQTYPLIT
ncbi:MAG: type IV secretory system conjugative DNA transfer family protein [Candidatus Saccharimonadales bacterium]